MIYIFSDKLLLGVSVASLPASDLALKSDFVSAEASICSTIFSIISPMTTNDGSTMKFMKPI